MTVLKGEQARSATRQAIVMDMNDLQRQAAVIIARAGERARQIIEASRTANDGQLAGMRAEAAEAAEAGRRAGFEAGVAEGREEGRRQGAEEAGAEMTAAVAAMGRIEQTWIAAAGQWDEQRRRIQREAERAVIEFAMAMTRKIIHRAVVCNDVVVDQVAAALSHVLRPMDLVIRIDPSDRESVERELPRLVAAVAGLEHVRLVDDPAVGRGGCVIDCAQGRIDATVQTQLNRVVELMVPAGDEPAPEPSEAPRDADQQAARDLPAPAPDAEASPPAAPVHAPAAGEEEASA